eukprot:CAMPEP_0184348822 /NCGR_PEP_ID=MMETSP1089-20130417/31120_1 /TAXON_ID=38269 ORGANISM="Gloeochaete wittrockiana, Strain SAG46.84" /NCGR_SAMPLE_ID=MMETSP1089 /ASSEMBLY_ACC=CAM_ASM_000445 /LENGTH=146 /DNA_ID=CAMNT_0026680767 /DNA_START=22 /DNA_END=462 /DNA_ORIENTATION=+
MSFSVDPVSAALRSPSSTTATLYGSLTATAIVPYLFSSIWKMDPLNYASLYVVVTLITGYMLFKSYVNVASPIARANAKKSNVDAEKHAGSALWFSIFFNNIFFLFLFFVLAFYLFRDFHGPFNYLLSVSLAAATVNFNAIHHLRN